MEVDSPFSAALWEESGTVSLVEALARNQESAASWPVGGRLTQFAQNWDKLAAQTSWTHQMVSRGVELEWEESPPEHILRGYQATLSEEDCLALAAEVDSFKQAGAVREVAPSFARAVLPLFTVPKKDGGRRGVINATPLNAYLHCPHFRVEGLETIASLVQQDDWLMAFDLTKAYLHVALPLETSRYLCFQWEGKTWAFTAMPFGLNIAPRVFTKVMRVPIAELRLHGVVVTIYLDDILIAAHSRREAVRNGVFVVLLLTALGFVLNPSKCSLKPSRRLEHLGMMVDTTSLRFEVPRDKVISTLSAVRGVLREGGPPMKVRDLARVTGTLSALRAAVEPAHLFLLHLNRLVSTTVAAEGWNGRVRLDGPARRDLEWWLAYLPEHHSAPFAVVRPTVVIQTDASFLAWAGVLRTNRDLYRETRGLWPAGTNPHSISPLELEAGIRTLEIFSDIVRGTHVLWRCDNASVVFGLQKWKSTSTEMNSGFRRLFELVSALDIRLTSEHVPGAENHRADFLSRWIDPEDWKIHPRIFEAATALLGPCEVDAFATSENTLLPKWWSRFPSLGCAAVDALKQDFSKTRAWCNPPFSLLLVLLRRLMAQTATAVVCVPAWPSQAWWPLLLEMVIQPPLLLPQRPGLFLPQSTLNQAPKGAPAWPAWVVEVSGHPRARREALKRFGPALLVPKEVLLSVDLRTAPRTLHSTAQTVG